MIPLLLKILKTGIVTEPAPAAREEFRQRASAIQNAILHKLGRALTIRAVDAGSCNGCEIEITGLSSPVYEVFSDAVMLSVAPPTGDAVPVIVRVNGVESQTVTMAIQ